MERRRAKNPHKGLLLLAVPFEAQCWLNKWVLALCQTLLFNPMHFRRGFYYVRFPSDLPLGV